MRTKLVIGIDPGESYTGLCIYKKGVTKPIIDFWTHDYSLDDSLYKQVYNSVMTAVIKCVTKPDLVIIESFIGRGNTREIIGVIKFYLDKHGINYTEVIPGHAKLFLTGSGKATKSQIIKSVNNKFDLLLKYKDRHSADAISVAYCCEEITEDGWKKIERGEI